MLGRKYLRKATFAAAAVIRNEAIERAPIRTGNLKSHIAIFKRPGAINTASYAIGVRPIKLNKKIKNVLRILRKAGTPISIEGNPYYWRFVEFGTEKMRAHPFLRPAFESKKETAIE